MHRTCVCRIRHLAQCHTFAYLPSLLPTSGAEVSQHMDHHHHQIRSQFLHASRPQISTEANFFEAVPNFHPLPIHSGLADLRESNGCDSNSTTIPQRDEHSYVQPDPSAQVYIKALSQLGTCGRPSLLGPNCATSIRTFSSAALRLRDGIETKPRGWSWHQQRNARVNGSEVLILVESL